MNVVYFNASKMQQNELKVDVEQVRNAIVQSLPITITTYTLPHEMEVYIADVLKCFLTELNQQQYMESLSYCITELVNNAKKANTKRIYFEEHKLDIFNRDDYEKGMSTFKADTLPHIKRYLKIQEQKGLYIKVTMQTINNQIKIEIRNNVELTVFEYRRMLDRIRKSMRYPTMEECMPHVLDDTEGAGLGLTIMMQVLRKNGLTEKNYQILCENGVTITRLILPLSTITQKNMEEITSALAKNVEVFPEFVENLAEDVEKIRNSEVLLSDVAILISRDLAVSGQIMHHANKIQPCSTIKDAVKLLGRSRIEQILVTMSQHPDCVVEENDSLKEIRIHAAQVAYYSYNLAKNFTGNEQFADECYLCGLVHDMGKYVFEASSDSIMDKIDELCEQKGISVDMCKKLLSGVNHGEVGSMLAQKWNFPSDVAEVVRFHHEPMNASSSVKSKAAVVYMADSLVHLGEHKMDVDQFDFEVLRMFAVTQQSQIYKLNEVLQASWDGINFVEEEA